MKCIECGKPAVRIVSWGVHTPRLEKVEVYICQEHASWLWEKLKYNDSVVVKQI